MSRSDGLKILFVVWALSFQVLLIVHYALRKWAFDRFTYQFGWIVYATGIPAAIVSLILLTGGQPWVFWTGGFIHLVWAAFGFWTDYIQKIQWRSPFRWPVGGPYMFLYLTTLMFYWWPAGRVSRPLWYVYAVLYAISTTLNILSHKG